MSGESQEKAGGGEQDAASPEERDEVFLLDVPEYDVFEGSEPIEVFGTIEVAEGDGEVVEP